MRTILAGILLSATLLLAGCTMTIQPEGEAAVPAPQTPTPAPEGAEQPNPTTFVLPDGATCRWAGEGATLAFDGERVNYTCDMAPKGKTSGLLDSPVQSGPTEWTVVLATIGRNDADTEFVLDSREEIEFTAWSIDLRGGTRCLHAGFGATLGFDEGRANYTCDIIAADAMGPTNGGDWVILGELNDVGMGQWTATRGEVVQGDDGFELVASENVLVTTVSGLDVSAPTATATPAAEEEPTAEASEEPTEEAEATPTPDDAAGASETIDPALLGITWQWVRTEQPDGTFVESLDPTRYTLTFMDDGSVGAQFDCNSGGGSYTVAGSNLTFGPLVTTLMACPGESQADVFGEQLAQVTGYALAGDTLTLTLTGGGTMTFTAAAATDAEMETEAGTDAGPTNDATEDVTEDATENDTESDTPENDAAESETAEDEMANNPLTGTVWGWTRTEYGNDTVVEAADPSRYTLTFEGDDNLAVLLDCNRGRGTYTLDGSSLSFGPIASTRMACPGDSQADRFAQDLENVVSFVLDGDVLALSLWADGGIMFFSPLE